MKKKIKADSVDELFEIVKAIQNGEEPEVYVKRKAEEERAARLAAQKAEEEARKAEEQERAAAKAAQKAAREERAAARAAQRAAQKAEEPEQASAKAAHRAAEEAEEQEHTATAKTRRTAQEEPRDVDTFERELEAEEDEDFGDTIAALKERLNQAGALIRKGTQSFGKKCREAADTVRAALHSLTQKAKRTRIGQTGESETETEKEEESSRSRLDGAAQGGKTRRRYGAKSVSEEAETVGKRILHSLHMESSGETSSHQAAAEKQSETERNPSSIVKAEVGSKASEQSQENKPETAKEDTGETMDLDTLQILDRILDARTDESSDARDVQNTESARAPADAQTPASGELVSKEPVSKEFASRESASKEPVTKDPAPEEPALKEFASEKSVSEKPESEKPASAFEGCLSKVRNLLKHRKPEKPGIEEKRNAPRLGGALEMPPRQGSADIPPEGRGCPPARADRAANERNAPRLGGAIILLALVLVAAAALSLANHMLTIQEKKKYVTADAGLNILVENQPKEWCTSCELQLKISVKSGTISSITIGGISCQPDERGYVTVTAAQELLEAVIETDSGTLTASIEIPMLDAEAPTLTAEKSAGEIILTAADARSGVSAIWYAILDEGDWLQLPVYQKYSDPILFEEDKTYYFYAADQAGNCSIPFATSMETAESISVNASELSLFPGETGEITAEVNPSGALFTGLSYQSSNTEVATVSTSGVVTAVAVGSALIQVSADGLDPVSCQVNVISEQTIAISAIGDCTLGTYAGAASSTSFNTYYSMYGATYFFENVREILENDDFTFANLEGTLTDETTPLDKTYAFKGDPSYTEILLDGSIEVVTLANNHSSDYGAQSLVDTKENLTSAGIEYCIGNTIAYEELAGIKVAFIGIYELSTGLECESQVRETIAEAQAEGARLIIVAFHWGTEKETAADEIQQSLAHTAIDCGADLVVGHHPHVLQGIEKYNGKYIVYSLGNFCFGGNSNPSDKATMIFRQTFTITSDGTADDDAIEIIPCTLSSASGYNDYRPTPATGSTADEIMERINEYSSAFGDIVYTASTGV